MSFDKQSFLAQGPTVVAFEVFPSTDTQLGVGVTGIECGVHGVCSDVDAVDPREVESGSGVIGTGHKFGVIGKGPIGVKATCNTHDGSFTDELLETASAIVARAEKPTQRRVSGMGIQSWAEANRAGVFQTGRGNDKPIEFVPRLTDIFAQVHLSPVEVNNTNFSPKTGPKDGIAGDLISVRAGTDVQLWFCKESSTSTVETDPTGATTKILVSAATWIKLA